MKKLKELEEELERLKKENPIKRNQKNIEESHATRQNKATKSLDKSS